MDEVARLLRDQAGVIARRQVLAAGGSPATLERALRRREWVRLLPGVFVDHTGPPTWLQRAWAGALYYGPGAALGGRSALRAVAGPGWRRHPDHLAIEVVIDTRRRPPRPVPGYRPTRRTGLDSLVQWTAGPPRMRLEPAALDVAAETSSEVEVVALLADLCQGRWTTAERLLAALDARARLPRRAWIADVLHDIANGTCSALEHGYLHRVERAHRLPPSVRQDQEIPGTYRDVRYHDFALDVELDGRLFHDSAAARDLDLDRDLQAAVAGRSTVRLGWGQVFGRPCRTAGQVAALLHQRGWDGAMHPCGPDCRAGNAARWTS